MLQKRLIAAGMHFGVGAIIGALILGLVFVFWYPGPLSAISGITSILIIVLGVDIVLGPLITLLVFDRRKRRLWLDLMIIAGLQLGALGYGVWTIDAGRPKWLAYVKDRIEVIASADLRPEDRHEASDNPYATAYWFSPRLVSVAEPDPAKSDSILFEAAQGGRDIQHFPTLYRDYAPQASRAVARSGSIDDLVRANPERAVDIGQWLERHQRTLADTRFLPVKGHTGDAAMLIDTTDGAPLGMLDLEPWL